MAKKKIPLAPRDLHEYEVTLEATYVATETATISLMASNETEAEEMAITETQDGEHFGDGEFVGEEGFYDADFEAIRVERMDGEEREEDDH